MSNITMATKGFNICEQTGKNLEITAIFDTDFYLTAKNFILQTKTPDYLVLCNKNYFKF